MKSTLYDLNNNLICGSIETALDHYDTITIKNRLLNGEYHVQTIGSPLKIFDISLNVDEDERKNINYLQAIGTTVMFKRDGYYYKGLISELPTWTPKVLGEYNQRKYTGTISLMVNEEGVDA